MWRHAVAAAAVLALHALIVLPLLYHAAPPPLPVEPTLVTVDLTASEKTEAPALKPVEIPEPVLAQPVISMPIMPRPRLPSPVPTTKPAPAAPAVAPKQSTAAAAPSGMASSSSDAIKERYTAKLRAWLAAHKRYPLQARRMRIKGSTILQLSVAPDGHVVAHRIERSTGSDLLDREVEAMLARSEPLPAPPPELAGGHLEFRFPIRFDPGEFD